MDKNHKTKQLLKILVGAAWIDGSIQPEEREYLRQMAQDNKLSDDPEIKSLLSEIKPVQSQECYRWLEEYLGDNHSEADYQSLLDAISALVYSDSEIDSEEAKLLTQLQLRDPANEPHSIFDKLLRRIQKVYRQAIEQS